MKARFRDLGRSIRRYARAHDTTAANPYPTPPRRNGYTSFVSRRGASAVVAPLLVSSGFLCGASSLLHCVWHPRQRARDGKGDGRLPSEPPTDSSPSAASARRVSSSPLLCLQEADTCSTYRAARRPSRCFQPSCEPPSPVTRAREVVANREPRSFCGGARAAQRGAASRRGSAACTCVLRATTCCCSVAACAPRRGTVSTSSPSAASSPRRLARHLCARRPRRFCSQLLPVGSCINWHAAPPRRRAALAVALRERPPRRYAADGGYRPPSGLGARPRYWRSAAPMRADLWTASACQACCAARGALQHGKLLGQQQRRI